jgi:hypothetical protein
MGQLRRFHGRFAWRVVQTEDELRKETRSKSNVIFRADPSVSQIDASFFKDLPPNYSKRVVCMGEDFQCSVSGVDDYFRWPLKQNGLSVKAARDTGSKRKPRFRRKVR